VWGASSHVSDSGFQALFSRSSLFHSLLIPYLPSVSYLTPAPALEILPRRSRHTQHLLTTPACTGQHKATPSFRVREQERSPRGQWTAGHPTARTHHDEMRSPARNRRSRSAFSLERTRPTSGCQQTREMKGHNSSLMERHGTACENGTKKRKLGSFVRCGRIYGCHHGWVARKTHEL
jgi:hypothetical protein